jgi:sulfide:quinone oxidoreductase
VPGAVTFWGAADEGGFAGLLRRLRAGMLRDVLFTIPSGTWGLRAYELALLSSAVLARSGIEDARLVVATSEEAPLELLGPTVGKQMEQLLAGNRIEVIAGVDPVAFEEGRLRVVSGGPIETEAVVSLPRLEGRRIDGLPADGAGFLPVDEHRRVLAAERVFAAGDVTAFPLKHGGIATQEAGVAAEAIAAAAGCAIEPASFDPVLRSVLWAGGGPRYLYGRLAESHGDASELGTERLWPESEARGAGHYSSPFLAALPDAERRGVPLD